MNDNRENFRIQNWKKKGYEGKERDIGIEMDI